MRAKCRLFDGCAETDQEPHFVKLNQTSISAAPHLFYTIISVEVVLCCVSILLHPLMCISVLRAVDDPIMFTCDLLRDMVLGYFCSMYELASPSTLLVLIGAELALTLPLIIGGALCFLGFLSIAFNAIIYSIMFTISTLVFLRTYFMNVAILDRMESGDTVGSYFVAKRFQVKENVLVMKYMLRISAIPACLAVPTFGCFNFKVFGPRDWLDARNIAYACFDLLIASAGLSFMIGVVFWNRMVRAELNSLLIVRACMRLLPHDRGQSTTATTIGNPSINEGHEYFTRLRNSWR